VDSGGQNSDGSWINIACPDCQVTTRPIAFIIQYLKGKDWTSPTEIGKAYGRSINSTGCDMHSAWASPRCKQLVEKELLIRNKNGWYKLSKIERTLNV